MNWLTKRHYVKFDNPRKQTPDGLKKSLLLNYPGCSNVLEALEKAKTKTPSNYEVLRSAISEIRDYLGDYDIDLMDRNKRIELYKIPLDSIKNVELWKRGWLNVGKL